VTYHCLDKYFLHASIFILVTRVQTFVIYVKDNSDIEKEKAEHYKDLHLWKYESACEQMKTDKKDFSMDCISFNLQQIL
jgi:hypothetical protein